MESPQMTVIVFLLSIFSLFLALFFFGISLPPELVRKHRSRTLQSTTRSSKESPSATLPDPDPLLEFDIETAVTRNHVYVNKTLRYPYHQTMAHQPMHINNWIEIDKDYVWTLGEKARLIQEHGKAVVDSLPECDDGCTELLQLLVDWLSKRYPTLFKRLDNGNGILNKVLNETITDIRKKRGVDALVAISRLVQDDFLMAKERSDGHVYYVGGLLTFPGSQSIQISEKIGKSMKEAHEPVPYFNEKLLLSVERTLKKCKPHEPFERTSWEVADDRNLFRHNINDSTSFIPESIHPKDLFLRVDHQTFRKLPQSQVIVFGARRILKRFEDLKNSPLVPELLVRILEDSDEELLKYKQASTYKDRLIPYLKSLTQYQMQSGLIKGDELVADFRLLVGEDNIPSTQTSLSIPTESELLLTRERT